MLDIILNHAGDVFGNRYDPERYPVRDRDGNVVRDVNGNVAMDPRWDDHQYPDQGFKGTSGSPSTDFAPLGAPGGIDRAGGVWPAELYQPQAFSRWSLPGADVQGVDDETRVVPRSSFSRGQHVQTAVGPRLFALNIGCIPLSLSLAGC